jgi:uncharacterized protein YdhG (YjbR/CyaY superfamily)
MAATKTTTTTRRTRGSGAADNVWTDEERAAMQESARERKSQSKLSPDEERAAGEREIQAKIADMPEPDRTMAQRIHALVTKTAPGFMPRTYYGMPAYAMGGKVICFFQPATKFKVRYSTFGFQPDARIDEGDMWPVAFAVTELTPAVEARIAELVKKAAG